MARYHLAQFNLTYLKQPLDHPDSAGFVNWVDPIHEIADRTPGFLWRYIPDGAADALNERPLGENGIINFTVWESRETMDAFVYRADHGAALKRRREWFHDATQPNVVLWWIPAGHTPSLDEALERLDYLRANGPSPHAFPPRLRYSAEDAFGSLAAADASAPTSDARSAG